MGEKAEKNSSTDYFWSLLGKIKEGGLPVFINNPFKRNSEGDQDAFGALLSQGRVCSMEEKGKHSNEKAELFCLEDKEKGRKRKNESPIEVVQILLSSGGSEDGGSRKEEKKRKSQKVTRANVEPRDEEKSGLEETGKERHKKKGKEKQTKKDKKRKEELLEELYEGRVEKKRRTLKSEETDITKNEDKLKTKDGKSAREQGLEGVLSKKLKHVIPNSESVPVKSVGLGDAAKVVTSNDAQPRKRKREEMDAANENNRASEVKNASVEPTIFPTKKRGKRNRKEEIAAMVSPKQAFDDEDKLHRTIFVGNLPVKTNKKHLIREFSRFGQVESVRLRSVPLVETKMPRKNAILTKNINEAIGSCHAYIVFNHERSANDALSHNMTEFGGNHIRVDRAQPPSKKLRGENHFIYDAKRTVFVGNLPFDVKDEELYQLFLGIKALESSVEAIRVIRDPHTSKGKGIAYVLFKTTDAAKLAVKKNKLKLRDRDLRLSRAISDSLKRTWPLSTSAGYYANENEKRSRIKRPAQSVESAGDTNKKRAKLSYSYQGTTANKKANVSLKFNSPGVVTNKKVPEASSQAKRKFKRPAVAARKARLSKSPMAVDKKRKREGSSSGNSRFQKKGRFQ
eukprot:TRINITY_DN1960_c0_g1_i2.p1 TRINITY_DN1960_c0_g1~~TRINITY_DN1960_c0_g1_i2.p1  ORF type:complete len:654 (+),score=159.34 TRINITY_DN1960_c0_g1_i2:90-1964(+)